MILQALVKEYEALSKDGRVPRYGWSTQPVSWGVELSTDGRIKGFIDLREPAASGKKAVPCHMAAPYEGGRNAVRSNFLLDESRYLFGKERVLKPGEKPSRWAASEYFENAKQKHLDLLKNVSGDAALAVCSYFETWTPDSCGTSDVFLERVSDFSDADNFVFYFNGCPVFDYPEIAACWDEYMKQAYLDRDADGICLVTGEHSVISRSHYLIKGRGIQSSGARLVSFYSDSFCSHGRREGYNAPVSVYADYAYTTALNHLLGQFDYRVAIGDSTMVSWAESGEEKYQKMLMAGGAFRRSGTNEIRQVLEHVRKAEPVSLDGELFDLKQNYYLLCLSPNMGRISVRFFYRNSFGSILSHIAQHYEDLTIMRPAYEKSEWISVDDMISASVNQNVSDPKPEPGMPVKLFLAVLSGTRYPDRLYTDILRRIRMEQGHVTWTRASVLKACLVRNYKKEEDLMKLNETCGDPAYVCGRLFALLEQIQKSANPGINATIRDRYFNAACTSPASVFPVLLRLSNSHLGKCAEGLQKWYEKQLSGVMGLLEAFPRHFSLQEQGMFMLGYYHQMNYKEEKKDA